MKKVITISLLLIFVLAGCVEQNNDKQDEGDKTLRNDRTLDFERPEEKPNISGIVKIIIGNEVTILKIERSMRIENGDMENRDIEKDDSRTEQRPASGFGGGIGGHGMGMGGGVNTGMAADSDERLEMLKSMSAGEEKIIIPVGIKMLKKDNEKEDEKMVEATLDDIAKDKMLMIWTDEAITDKNIANFVIIN
ncbi:hypothetical protein KAS41_00255 [Candidatus Parcubacteria bacterium]|nr:hypothetical protein [Candidatus Parcubacteria bacterium]